MDPPTSLATNGIPAGTASDAGRANYEFAKREQFIKREERIFLKLASAPHAKLIQP